MTKVRKKALSLSSKTHNLRILPSLARKTAVLSSEENVKGKLTVRPNFVSSQQDTMMTDMSACCLIFQVLEAA